MSARGVKIQTLYALSLCTGANTTVGNKLICGCFAFNSASCEIADHEFFLKFGFVSDLELVTDIKIRTDGGAKNQHSKSKRKNLQSNN